MPEKKKKKENKKANVKLDDLKPRKDTKGGGGWTRGASGTVGTDDIQIRHA